MMFFFWKNEFESFYVKLKKGFVEKWKCLKPTEEWKVGFIPSDTTGSVFNFPVNDILFFSTTTLKALDQYHQIKTRFVFLISS